MVRLSARPKSREGLLVAHISKQSSWAMSAQFLSRFADLAGPHIHDVPGCNLLHFFEVTGAKMNDIGRVWISPNSPMVVLLRMFMLKPTSCFPEVPTVSSLPTWETAVPCFTGQEARQDVSRADCSLEQTQLCEKSD